MGHDSSVLLRVLKLLGGGVGLRENPLARTLEPARKVCGRYAGPQVQKKKRVPSVCNSNNRVDNSICSKLCKEREGKTRNSKKSSEKLHEMIMGCRR